MKATGVIRRMDELGRIVIPKEIRSSMNISPDDEMEILINENRNAIIIKKLENTENLSLMIKQFDESVENLSEEIGKEKSEKIKQHINDILKILDV